MNIQRQKRFLVIVGPTTSGKSALAVKLALEFDGEVISADSRQIYRDLDIATGKITNDEMRGVLHHCIDIADPNERFTVLDWKKEAEKAIDDIHARNKLPIICGGTGFYISALIDGTEFPSVSPDTNEQKRLELKTADELFSELKILDPRRARDMEKNGDNKNKRRVARAIIIARALGKVPTLSRSTSDRSKNASSSANIQTFFFRVKTWNVQFIGLDLPDIELKERIRARTLERIKDGMIEEARSLHTGNTNNFSGLSFERMREIGLEYKYLADFLENKISREQLIETIITKDWQYARRQRTWWRKDKRIKWFGPEDFERIKLTIL